MNAQNTISMLNRLHQVNKGETIFSIAKQYNITEQELLLANPDIGKKGKLKKGTYLAIPPTSAPESETALEIEQKKPITKITIGVILPFEEKTERAKKMVEFYQGFLMAADSVKKEGMSLEIYTYSSGTTEAELINVLMNPEMATLNILFGPVDEQQLPATINFCKQNNIKLVLPFTNGQSLIENPHVYMASPNYAVGTTEAATLVSRAYANKNYIILKTNSEKAKSAMQYC